MDTFFYAGLLVGWVGFWLYLLLASSLGFLLWLTGVIMVMCVVIPGLIRLVIDRYRLWGLVDTRRPRS